MKGPSEHGGGCSENISTRFSLHPAVGPVPREHSSFAGKGLQDGTPLAPDKFLDELTSRATSQHTSRTPTRHAEDTEPWILGPDGGPAGTVFAAMVGRPGDMAGRQQGYIV